MSGKRVGGRASVTSARKTGVRCFAALIVIVTVTACASRPPPHTAPAPAAAVQPSALPEAVTLPPGAAAPAAAPEHASDDKLVRAGYQPAMHHGKRVYCRVESQTGSRFASRVCLSAEEIRAREANAKEVLDTVRPDTTCALVKCN
jgi:hypothetical protein